MGEHQCDIMDLPDDVLASIFSYLDPIELIDNVPLVCKRWCQLSKHIDAWRYVDLLVPQRELSELAKEQISKDYLRIVKVAPYLRNLDLRMVDKIYPLAESVIKTLLEGNAIVKNFSTFPQCTKKMQNLTKRLLQKFSPSLCSITFTCHVDSQKAATFFDGVNELLQIISEAPRLNHLALDFHNLNCFKGYSGQLGKGCAVLKQFEVMKFEDSQNSIILDVLKNKKNQLVYVGFNSGISKDVANAFIECCGLSKCRLQLVNIPLVQSMSHLDALEIGFSVPEPPQHNIVESFKSSNVLPNISKLTLYSACMNLCDASLLLKSTNALELLAEKCKNVNVFKLVEITLPDHLLNSLMTSFQNLQEISFECCGGIKVHHINMLSELPCLRVIDICEVSVHTDADGADLQTALDKLRLSKPNAVINFSYELSLFVEGSGDDWCTDDDDLDYDFDYDDYGDYQFTYYDYLRNKYGDDISDMDLWALASSDED